MSKRVPKDYKADSVRDIDLSSIKTFSDLCESLISAGGFMGKNLGLAVRIVKDMITDEDCTVFMSFTGNTVATGLRGVYKTMVEKRLVDVIITTVGTLDHDIARSWRTYYQGDFFEDDTRLLKNGFHRLGNIIIPFENYGEIIEEKVRKVLERIYNDGTREISTYELCWLLGKEAVSEDSILYWAYKNKVPIIIPGPLDGAVGSQLWFFQQIHRDFRLNVFKDEELLSNIVFEAKKTGAIIIGGGISKHHLLWWNQFRGGLDYAIQISTAIEYDGSLSGARLDEAISWKKISDKSIRVNVIADATIALPLIMRAVLEHINE